MTLQISKEERDIVRTLESGIRGARVFKAGAYPGAVSVESVHGRWVTIRPRSVDLAARFEVFPITVSDGLVQGEFHQEISIPELAGGCAASVLRKAEWAVPSNSSERKSMTGNPEGATTQYEGSPSTVPLNALHSVVLDAGFEFRAAQGRAFSVATSMSPFALYVSNCSFSEALPASIYEHVGLR